MKIQFEAERRDANYYKNKYLKCWEFLEVFTHYLFQVIQTADQHIKNHSTITEGILLTSRSQRRSQAADFQIKTA
jgi:hypothetical protein